MEPTRFNPHHVAIGRSNLTRAGIERAARVALQDLTETGDARTGTFLLKLCRIAEVDIYLRNRARWESTGEVAR